MALCHLRKLRVIVSARPGNVVEEVVNRTSVDAIDLELVVDVLLLDLLVRGNVDSLAGRHDELEVLYLSLFCQCRQVG